MEHTAEIVQKKRGVNLLYFGYRHKKDRLVDGGAKQHWRCVEKGCSARVHTTGQDDELHVTFYKGHDHISDPEALVSARIKAELCQRAAEDFLTPLSQVCIIYK